MFSCRGEKKNGSHARRCAGETPAWGLLEGDSEGKGSSQHCGGEQWEEHAVILHVTLMRTRVPSRLRGCTMQRKWITNNVAMLSNNTVSWSCHCCLEAGQKVPSKAATSAFYLLSAARAAFSTFPLPDLLLVFAAANPVGDLLPTCVCSSRSVSWLWFGLAW